VLDLPGGVHALARLIQKSALVGYDRDRSEAHGSHRDQEKGDQEKRPEELRVERGAGARDPSHEGAQRPVGEQETGDSLGQPGRRARDRAAGSDAVFALVRTHTARFGDHPAGCYQAKHTRSMRRLVS
jgi:hypothetical protein